MQCSFCNKEILKQDKLFFWDALTQYNLSLIQEVQICEECFNTKIQENNINDNKIIEKNNEPTN